MGLVYRNVLKRFFDFTFALFLLAFLSPLIFTVAIILSIEHRGTPFFVQTRPGRNEDLFKIYKFKTMNDNTDKYGKLLSDKYRLTKVGKAIRKMSLDETPQLINVLLGQMSFVGPRPLLCSYLPYFSTKERLRAKVRPGITGLAQVNGRNTLNWDDRLALDVVYVESLSFKLDCTIIFKTLLQVFTANGLIIDPGSELENLDVQRKVNK